MFFPSNSPCGEAALAPPAWSVLADRRPRPWQRGPDPEADQVEVQGGASRYPTDRRKRPQPAHFPAQSKEEERVRTECLSVPTPARPPSLKTLPSGNKHFVQGTTGENWSDGCCTSLSTSTLRGGDVTGAQNLGGASPTTCSAEARPSGSGGAGFKSTASQEQLKRENHTLSPKVRTTSPRLDSRPVSFLPN